MGKWKNNANGHVVHRIKAMLHEKQAIRIFIFGTEQEMASLERTSKDFLNTIKFGYPNRE